MIMSIDSVFGDLSATRVERAISELRSARPVRLMDEGAAVLAVPVEALDATRAAALEKLADGRARLVLAPKRLRRLGGVGAQPGTIGLPTLDRARIDRLAMAVDGAVDGVVTAATSLDEAALELARLAFILPALVIVPDIDLPGTTEIDAQSVMAYRQTVVPRLTIVGRAPVPLEGAPDTEFVVFRGGEGLRDQVAILVGKPDLAQPVHVRLHSACLTGDLFGSLKCDCGDQLRDTVQAMTENGGGILLYLDQEGRGNGLSNKIRAYRLQSEGFDTYEADEILGFDLDQRRFGFAAEMLRRLGVTRVRIMTNNPDKIAALRKAGLDVVAEQRVFGRATPENLRYLATKRDRAGHAIDLQKLVGRE
jgi:GTP cyclohydrolase II